MVKPCEIQQFSQVTYTQRLEESHISHTCDMFIYRYYSPPYHVSLIKMLNDARDAFIPFRLLILQTVDAICLYAK